MIDFPELTAAHVEGARESASRQNMIAALPASHGRCHAKAFVLQRGSPNGRHLQISLARPNFAR